VLVDNWMQVPWARSYGFVLTYKGTTLARVADCLRGNGSNKRAF